MQKKHKLFDFRRLPMDLARLVCLPLIPLFRMKRLTPDGKKYKGRIRGGAILAANHTSFTDPFLLGVAVWYRRLFFLAAEAVMKGKLRKVLLKGVGAIEIDRYGTDIEAARKSVDILKKGYLLAVFPQGGIARDEQVQTLKGGVVLFALQAGVPIVPMHVVPKKHWYSRRVVVIGQTLDPKAYVEKKFPSTADIDRISQKLLEEMNRCMVHQ
ncbi:MAG: 1-acyl-sn-glycerol-3-phosphate acyltransferase [Oscillospiraceae bacterium]|nr:1-acyl-sn-glycerol-3-phosphate acyltransferase [Oscillospiraceae bacterium]